MIELKNITKKYGESIIFDNLSFSFPSKGLVVIKGPSGCGKSTLLNLIGGIDLEYEGKIFFDGKIVSKKEDPIYLKDAVSYVFQEFNLIEQLTVKENLLIKHKKISKKDQNIIKDLKLDLLLNKKVKKLSNGEKQRVAIARSIFSSSEVILLDEPTSSLDKENKEIIFKKLLEEAKDKLIIVVTHDEDVFSSQENILTIENGKLNGTIKKQKYKAMEIKKKENFKLTKLMKAILKIKSNKIIYLALCLSFSITSIFAINKVIDSFQVKIKEEINEKSDYLMLEKENVNNLDFVSFNNISEENKAYLKNYYIEIINEKLYDVNIFLDNQKFGSGFVFSKTKYTSENLSDNEIILAGSRVAICEFLSVDDCENELENYLINKEIKLELNKNETYDFVIKGFLEEDETFIYSNNRYLNKEYLKSDNDKYYYYWEVNNSKLDDFNNIIKKYDYLSFELFKVKDDRYTFLLKTPTKRFFTENEINGFTFDYIYCLNNGCNCYEKYGEITLPFIEEISHATNKKEGKEMYFKPFNEFNMSLNEIGISSSLAKSLDVKNINTYVYLKIADDKDVFLKVKYIIENEKNVIYQNSSWSYYFFKNILLLDTFELRSALILVDKDNLSLINKDYKVVNFYEDVSNSFNQSEVTIKKYSNYLLIFISINFIFVYFCIKALEYIEDEKLYGLLRIIGVDKAKVVVLQLIKESITVMLAFIIGVISYKFVENLFINQGIYVRFDIFDQTILLIALFLVNFASAMFIIKNTASKSIKKLIN